ARASLQRQANNIVVGRFRLFGHRLVPLEFGTAKRLAHWTEYELKASLLSSLGPRNPDVKFLWEPARFGWAYTLGRAFHLSGRENLARAFWLHFERFDKRFPPYWGPHWMNGQEVALRLMALLWSAQVFAPASATTPKRMARLALAIARHAARIPPTLPYARSQGNNHLITEATALYLAGAALDRPGWRQLGWRWLNRGLQTQIGPDGEYIQHSTNYHRLMLQSALLADAARRLRQEEWPVPTRQALARATRWLLSLTDPLSGKVPNLGANDGSLILPLSSVAYDDFRPTVQAATRAFLGTGIPSGDWDELAIWLGIPDSGFSAPSSFLSPEPLRGSQSWAYLRASSFKTRLSHMDQLHVDLWWRGRNLACDAGTFQYNAPPPWDNPLVSSRVHNCLTVDGGEQMTRAGRFLVLDWFPASSRPALSVQPPVLRALTATHRGYDRLGVHHERTLGLLEGDRWRVHDRVSLSAPGPHVLRLHWLLVNGEYRLQRRGSQTRLRVRLPGGWLSIAVAVSDVAPAAMNVTLIRAGKLLRGRGPALPHEGWISPSYGRKVPALSLALEVLVSDACTLTTDFALPH
ncbi:MAG TPA: alginate lyase family protein, partial [Anaerolineales bacterium]|nr:alginate lyase family protein [Anaerolineales bacterium]